MALDKAAVILTVHEILSHPAVKDAVGPVFKDGMATLEFKLDLDFGARWLAQGASPTGVLPQEPVRLDFRPSFPRTAPRPSLRADFGRNYPHLQPYVTADGRPVPCLVDGSLGEFFAAQGAWRLVEQFRLWLRNAADGSLIDPAQGWEPMRRDRLVDQLVCDVDRLRAVVTPAGGQKAFALGFHWLPPRGDKAGTFLGQTGEAISNKFGFSFWKKIEREEDVVRGAGPAFIIWAGRDPAIGGPAICDQYAPDTVTDLTSLKALAATLKMGDGLRAVLTQVLDHAGDLIAPVPIILAVRRPYPLKDSHSNIELCAYLLPAQDTKLGLGNPKVTPLSLHEEVTPALLQRLTDAPAGLPWALLGCGSLGSKIALHRARDGAAPTICVDDGAFLPHNAARHGLYPRSSAGYGMLGAKATLLGETIAGLGQATRALYGDQRELVTAIEADADAPAWLLNTTASTVARDDLASGFAPAMPRVVEACLFDQGALGYFAVEGAGHNPDGVELMGELYVAARRDPMIGRHLFPKQGQLATINIGQGCGSLTMRVSDAKISSLAGVMAQTLSDLSPEMVEGRIDLLVRDGLAQIHQRLAITPWRRVPIEGLEGWMLSISPQALTKIEAEVAQYRKVETGGVLVGFHSMVARRIYVADVHAAPSDSVRRPHEFTLGVEGLAEARQSLAQETRGALTFAGTWHSHLGQATPSGLDRRSAALVGAGEPQPKAFLIYGTDGLRAISAATIAVQGLKEAI